MREDNGVNDRKEAVLTLRRRQSVSATIGVAVVICTLSLLAPQVFSQQSSTLPPSVSGMPEADLTPLPRLEIQLDKTRISCGEAWDDGEGVVVPLDTAVRALTNSAITLAPVSPKENMARLLDTNGNTVGKIPIGTGEVALLGTTSFLLPAAAQWIAGDEKRALTINLQSLAGLLGISYEKRGRIISLLTPMYWAKRLGLPQNRQTPETIASVLALRPELGISPPAKTALIWVRPPGEAGTVSVQVFALPVETAEGQPLPHKGNNNPRPLLGVSNAGDPIIFPEDGFGTPEPRKARYDDPVRVDCEFYPETKAEMENFGSEDLKHARFAPYVAILTKYPPENGNVLDAIRSGAIAPGDWSVVGIRQPIGRAFVNYELYSAKEGETPELLANRFTLPLPMLLSLNGLLASEAKMPLSKGTKIVYLQNFDAPMSNRQQELALENQGVIGTGETIPVPELKPSIKSTPDPNYYVEVEIGETTAELAQKANLTEDQILNANGLPPGADVTSGSIVVLPIANKTKLPKRPPLNSVFVGLRRIVRREGNVFRRHDSDSIAGTLPQGAVVTEMRRLPDYARSIVRYTVGSHQIEGWIATSYLKPITTATGPDTPSTPAGTAPAMLPIPSQYSPTIANIVREAVRWVNVPRYVWGGNNISSGIDCSHYVAAVYSRMRVAVPSPPVHSMEQYGSIVDWKPGLAEEGGALRNFPDNPRPFAALIPGDRIIFQCAPQRGVNGSHHTGIYLGRYGRYAHAVIHCNSSRNTVSIDELGARYLNSIYKYSVRGSQRRPAGSWTVAARAATPIPVASSPRIGREGTSR